MKILINYIFIYILFVGCESPILSCDTCDLNISAPDLEMDNNGYYHLEFLDEYTQTFTTLNADVGSSEKKVRWTTDKLYNIKYMGNDYWTELVNKNSYTNGEGIAHTVFSAWEEFMGDTIKVYCGYIDDCQVRYIDSLEVIIE